MVGSLHTMAWSPDSKLLAVSAEQSGMSATSIESFELWDITRGRALLSIRRGGLLGTSVITFALSPDGQTLAYLDNNTVKVWDIATERELRTLSSSGGERLGYLAFLPDGKTIASIYRNDASVITWDVETGRELSARNGISVPPSQPADYLIYSPDFAPFIENRHSHNGKIIEHSNITVDTAKSGRTTLVSIVLSDSASGETLQTLKANVNYSGNLARVFSPDDSLLASAGYAWDVQTGRQYELSGGANLAVFSPDGKFLAIGGQDGKVQLWGIRP
jgi:WD40 repeat protein